MTRRLYFGVRYDPFVGLSLVVTAEVLVTGAISSASSRSGKLLSSMAGLLATEYMTMRSICYSAGAVGRCTFTISYVLPYPFVYQAVTKDPSCEY